MDQRRKLLFAYKVRSTHLKTGQHSDSHTGRSSKVPLLPDLEAQRGVLNSTSDVHRSVPGMAMTSSVLKLPILPDSKLSDTEALVLAAATASQSMSALPFSSKSLARFGMSRSASEAMLPKRRTARNQILEKTGP
eukprot:s985_g21.t1